MITVFENIGIDAASARESEKTTRNVRKTPACAEFKIQPQIGTPGNLSKKRSVTNKSESTQKAPESLKKQPESLETPSTYVKFKIKPQIGKPGKLV